MERRVEGGEAQDVPSAWCLSAAVTPMGPYDGCTPVALGFVSALRVVSAACSWSGEQWCMRSAPNVRQGPAYVLLVVRGTRVLERRSVRTILGVIIDDDIVRNYDMLSVISGEYMRSSTVGRGRGCRAAVSLGRPRSRHCTRSRERKGVLDVSVRRRGRRGSSWLPY